MVSFQIPGTPGSILLEKKKFAIHGRIKKVEAEVGRFNFTSHGGKSDLRNIISNLKKNAKVFVMHGAEENCVNLASWASKKSKLKAVAPLPGDAFEV